MDEQNTARISMSLDDVNSFKRAITGDAAFSERISFALALQLLIMREREKEREDLIVISEIECLEEKISSSTKIASQFKYKPLWPFWHKHFTTSRHQVRNIGERWNVARGKGNRDLDRMISDVAAQHGENPSLWPEVLADRLVFEALRDRSTSQRLTGDWIIFAKHSEKNYYINLASHQQGESGLAAAELAARLRDGTASEWPFLFD